MTNKVAIIGTVGLPSNYGGFETLVDFITKDLNKNFDITVYCSATSYPNKLENYNNCRLHYINLSANGIQSVLYDIRAIFHSIKYADILLILGVSGCIILPFVKLFSKKKIIVNIDGVEWKRQKWNGLAKWFLKLSERFAVKSAHAIISDNKVIQDYVKKTYDKNAHLIAYGGDHCDSIPLSCETLKKHPFLSSKYAFKVCRIEPENNIKMILEAFTQVDNMSLVLVGNWSSSDFGNKMKYQYGYLNNIYLLDPIYDQNILNQIRSNCEIYIHGHSAGGTNPSLVEAMMLGLPIFCYNVNYNIETTENRSRYFKTSSELIKLLESKNKINLSEIGEKMKSIALRRYKWSEISEKYKNLFLNC